HGQGRRGRIEGAQRSRCRDDCAGPRQLHRPRHARRSHRTWRRYSHPVAGADCPGADRGAEPSSLARGRSRNMNTTFPSARAVRDILIAEDSVTQAQRLTHILETQGYRVMAAANGRIALEMAMRHKPDLIISDVVMPEMTGYELCRAVKTSAKL